MAALKQSVSAMVIVLLVMGLLVVTMLPKIPSLQQYFNPYATPIMDGKSDRDSDIWSVRHIVDWKPCEWWKSKPLI